MIATLRGSFLAGVVGTVIASALTVNAQTADQIKSRFATLFGPNKYARIVWQLESRNNVKTNNDINNGTSSLRAVDTKDGIVRTLVSTQTGKHWSGPTLTWDGRRVVYYDNNAHAIRIVNFDGTNDRLLLSAYEGEGRCWRSSDGKDWVLGTEFKNTATNARLMRVNIDSTAEKVALFQCSWQSAWGVGATQWASMSPDGKYVVGAFPNYGALGWFATAATPPTTFTSLNPNGCYGTISRDNQYHILYTDDGTLSHKELYVTELNGTVVLQKPLLAGGVFTSSSEQFESLRGTSDPDYCIFFSAPNNYDATGTSNPKIVRLSDLKWAAVHDNCTYPEGNGDAYIYTESGTQAVPHHVTLPGVRRSMQGRMFDLQGRQGLAGTGVRIALPAPGIVRPSRIIVGQ